MNGKKWLAGSLAAVLCAGSWMPGTVQTLQAEEPGSAMGRYVESEVALPENVDVYDIGRIEDGRLRIAGAVSEEDADGWHSYRKLWDSADGGETWEEAAVLTEALEDFLPCSLVLARDGGGVGLFKELEEVAYGDLTIETVEYQENCHYVSFDAKGEGKEPAKMEDGLGFWKLCMTSDGSVAGISSENGAWLLDRETGEPLKQVDTGCLLDAAVCGTELLLFEEQAVRRYDLAAETALERDEELEKVLLGKKEVISDLNPIITAEDEGHRLFYCTREGIFSHAMGGSVVEQVVDGQLTSFGGQDVTIVDMETADQGFYVLYHTNSDWQQHLVKLEYDAEVPSAPQKEITVYSLRENAAIRQAVTQFQKKYADIYVNYEVGISGADSITVSDAIRTLDAGILAGNGPDVLILDGLNVETYAEKGILADLREAVDAVREREGLLEHMAYTYQTKEGTLPVVPTRFGIPVLVGEPELVQACASEGLKGLASKECAISKSYAWTLPERLYTVCAGSWRQADGSLNQELLLEYVDAVCRIYRNYLETLSESERKEIEVNMEPQAAMSRFDARQQNKSAWDDISLYTALGVSDLKQERSLEIGTMYGMKSYSEISSVNREVGACAVAPVSGQQTNVFVPLAEVGVVSTSREQESALAFVSWLLSDHGQVKSDFDTGFPVNRMAFDHMLQDPYEGGVGYLLSALEEATGETSELMVYWPSGEELERMSAWVEKLTARIRMWLCGMPCWNRRIAACVVKSGRKRL